MHPVFSFTDAQFRDAYLRGADDGRRGRPFPPGAIQPASFTVNAVGQDKTATLALRLLLPLDEARYQGWIDARAGAVGDAGVEGALRRARGTLRFLVEETEDKPFDESEQELWNGVNYRLSAAGIDSLAPISQPRFRATRDLISDIAERETPLRFAAAAGLSAAAASVTVTISLDPQDVALAFPLPA